MSEVVFYELSDTVMAALLVIAGQYGNGTDRVTALKADGLDADKVQACVNDLLPIINKY